MATATHDWIETTDVLKLLNLVSDIRKILRRFRLKLLEYHALLILRKSPNTTPGEIGKQVPLLPAAVTRALNCLERAKLITRNFGQEDRRTVVVSLTKEGASLLQQIDRLVLHLGE
ncbi:MAG TPA: MarR family transcriptional regulator [Negativicutes bacterium]|nr:MAG: hypothetical protein A3A12_01360 [Candidatus Staskawiczbacteria bacterium RIFCSPLOWO2_01_FULL_43_17b]HLD70278.1 MarR family transcriptional regulator [Negativicutes bacterium]